MRIAIYPENTDSLAFAQQLAKDYGLALIHEIQQDHFDFILYLDLQKLKLRDMSYKQASFLEINFVEGALAYRKAKGGGHDQALAKALGLPNKGLKILDATAGLGRDAFLLAALGSQIVACERNPIVFLLLDSALKHWQEHTGIEKERQRLSFIHCDAIEALDNIQDIDAVYLDFMFPEKKKSALVKKEMQILQKLVGHDDCDSRIVEKALALAKKRVVVKRPVWADPVYPKVSRKLEGKTTRFDIYIP